MISKEKLISNYCSNIYSKLGPQVNSDKLLVEADTYIAGGALYSLLTGKHVNDIDIYFRDPQKALLCIRRFATVNAKIVDLGNSVKSLEITEIKATKNNCELSRNALTFIPNKEATGLPCTIQFIFKFIGEEEAVLRYFDFEHCKISWRKRAIDSNTENLSGVLKFHGDSKDAIINNELIYNTTTIYPIGSLFRVNKFIKRGMNIDFSELIKIAAQINQLDLVEPEALKLQASGYYGYSDKRLFNLIDKATVNNKVDLNKFIESL
jgi:hypothetical protein